MREKLKLHCDVISGYAFSSSDWKEEGIPVIKIGNISNGSDIDCDELQYVDEFFWDKLDPKYHISNGDILVSLTGSHINQPNSMVGRSCRSLTEKKYLLNQRAGKVIPFDNTDKNYLYYLLSTKAIKYDIANRAYGGANQVNVSPSDIKNIKWKFPLIEKQKKISGILLKYDELIQNNNKRIIQLEDIVQELYREWFVRFRFPGYENAKFEDGIPEGWKIKRMNEFCYVIDGTHDTPKPVDVGVPLVTGRCISSGFVDFDAAYNISETDHEGIKKRSGLKSGDILFSNIGTVGNSCIVDYNREFSVKNVIIFKPETMRDTAYLYYWMTSSIMQEIFSAQTNGASQQFVGLTFMRRYKLLVPKDDILEAFADKVLPIVEQKRLLHQKNLNLDAQRDMLLPRLMSGKLEV